MIPGSGLPVLSPVKEDEPRSGGGRRGSLASPFLERAGPERSAPRLRPVGVGRGADAALARSLIPALRSGSER